MSRKLFFSDCHISAGLGLEPGGLDTHAWEWLTPSDQRRLAAFIAWVTSRADEIDEVVLVGDIFDSWIFPHDIKPPTLFQIIASANATPLVQALDRLSRTIPTTILAGNHDIALSPAMLTLLLPKVTCPANGIYSSGLLHAEHGHAWGLFNASDPERQDNLPLGYFISRMVATADRRSGSHTPSIAGEIKEIGELIATQEKLPQGVFDGVCAKAGVSEGDTILMPDDLWDGEPTSVKEVRDIYKNLYHEWRTRNGTAGAVIAISAELNSLAIIADRIHITSGPRALIMGHTHEPVSQQITIPIIGNRVYVNAGAWCQRAEHAAWVEAEDRDGMVQLTVLGCTSFDSDGHPKGLTTLAGPVTA